MADKINDIRHWMIIITVLVILAAPGYFCLRLNYGNVLLFKTVIKDAPELSVHSQQVLKGLFETPLEATAHRNLAKLALLEGRFEEARVQASRAIEMSPSDWLAYDLTGRAYWALGQKEEARAVWQRKRLIAPRLAHLYWLGRHHFGQGNNEAAIAAFKQALELDPDWTGGYAALSNYYWDYGQSDLARPYLEKAAELLQKDSHGQLFVSGRLNLLDKKYTLAADQFCRAWTLNHQSSYLFSCLWVLRHLGDFDRAWHVIAETGRHHPEWAVNYAEEWGERLFSSGDYAQAARFYDIACQLMSSGACARKVEAETVNSK